MKLDYRSRSSVITLVFRSRRGRQKRDPEKWQHACSRVCSVMSDSAISWTVAPRLLCSWHYSAKNTGVGSRFLLQGSSLLKDQTHISWVSCIGKWILYQLNHQWSSMTPWEGLSSCWLWRRKGPWAKESRWPLEAANGKVIDSSKSIERRQPYRHIDFSPLRTHEGLLISATIR